MAALVIRDDMASGELRWRARREHDGRVSARLIALANAEETASADQAFADRFLASVSASVLSDSTPSCGSVRRELAQFERPRPAPSPRGETLMASHPRSPQTPEKHVRAAQIPRPKKLTETRRENLTSNQRDDLARKLAASQQRKRPPSI